MPVRVYAEGSTDDLLLKFSCGCQITYDVVDGRLIGVWTACPEHEGEEVSLVGTLPLTLVEIQRRQYPI